MPKGTAVTFHTLLKTMSWKGADKGSFHHLTFCLSPCLGCKVRRSSVVGVFPLASVVRGVANALVHDDRESSRLAPKLAAIFTDVLALLEDRAVIISRHI